MFSEDDEDDDDDEYEPQEAEASDGEGDDAGIYQGWPVHVRLAYAIATSNVPIEAQASNWSTTLRTAASRLTLYLRGKS